MGTNCFINPHGVAICWDDVYAPTDPAGGPRQLSPNPNPDEELGSGFPDFVPSTPSTPPLVDPDGLYFPDEWRRPSRLIALPSFSFPNIFFSEILDDKRRAWLAGERPVPGSEITLPDWSSEGPPRIPGQAAPDSEVEAGPGPNPDVTGDVTPIVNPLPAQRLGGVFWSGLVFATRPGTTVGVGGIDRFDNLFDFPSPSRARRAPAVPSMPDPNTPVSDAEADAVFGYPYSAVPVPPHASQQPATGDGTGETTTSAPAAPPPTAGGTTAAAPSGGVGHEGDTDLGNGFNPFSDWPHLAEDDFEIGSQATDRVLTPRFDIQGANFSSFARGTLPTSLAGFLTFISGPGDSERPAEQPAPPAPQPPSPPPPQQPPRRFSPDGPGDQLSRDAETLMLGVLAATDPNAAPVQTFVASPNPYFRSSEPSFFEIFGYQIPIPPVVLEVFGGTPTGASVGTRAPALGR